jgi:uncharacterized protein YgiM (DUF1202 family)
MKKHLYFLALAALVLMACSLTSGALYTPPEQPQPSATPETIATPTQAPQRCIVTTGTAAGRLNLRACAGTACGVIEVLEEGDRLQVVTLGDWLQVETEAGAAGFVNSKYCTLKTE